MSFKEAVEVAGLVIDGAGVLMTRSLRWINLALGLWLLAAPWLLSGYPADATANSMAAGALLAALSLVQGELRETYGGGWPAVWRSRSRP